MERPAGSRVRRHPLPFPVSPRSSLSGRLARCRAALLSLCISPPGGGEGVHCPEVARFPGGEGPCRGPQLPQGSPGRGRRRARTALGASRHRPQPSPQVGGAGRLCFEPGLRPARPGPQTHFLRAVCVPRTSAWLWGLRLGYPRLLPWAGGGVEVCFWNQN